METLPQMKCVGCRKDAPTVSDGELAEEEGHHPALLTEWGGTTVTWWTAQNQGPASQRFHHGGENGRAVSDERLDTRAPGLDARRRRGQARTFVLSRWASP